MFVTLGQFFSPFWMVGQFFSPFWMVGQFFNPFWMGDCRQICRRSQRLVFILDRTKVF
jgi:hypothetical protein